MSRSAENLTKALLGHCQNNCNDTINPIWEIKKSELGGFGVFATRCIEPGEIIFRDFPIILGPRFMRSSSNLCVNCYTKCDLQQCARECGLKVCAKCAQTANNHQKECKIIRQWRTRPISGELRDKLPQVLTPIRALLLSEEDKGLVRCLKAHLRAQHGAEIEVMKQELGLNFKEDEETFMRLVCAVMDANAFETITETEQVSLRGLYPLASLMNHSCAPNTTHVFDANHTMIVQAAVFIPHGGELFDSYARLIWATATRRLFLSRTKHFLCSCARCLDPTEFGAHLGAIYCKACKKGLLAAVGANKAAAWRCQLCGAKFSRGEVAAVSALLGSVVNSFDDGDVEFMLRFVRRKLPELAPACNEAGVAIKYGLVWVLGHRQGYTWSELSLELIDVKREFCKEMLDLVAVLRLGQCKMKGLLLFELYCCLKEIKKRQEGVPQSKGEEREMSGIFQEAAEILRYSASSPAEIKAHWMR